MGNVREWTLSRGVQPPVVFVGELLCSNDGVSGTSLWNSLVGGGRWHVLSVFQTTDGKLVIYITYRTKAKGEIDNREVFWCDQASDLSAIFAQYQEVAMPILTARMAVPAGKRQAVAMNVLARYQKQVAQVLATIPGARQAIV